MHGRSTYLGSEHCIFWPSSFADLGLPVVWSIPGGIYMVTNFLVNSVLAEIYFLVSSEECRSLSHLWNSKLVHAFT